MNNENFPHGNDFSGFTVSLYLTSIGLTVKFTTNLKMHLKKHNEEFLYVKKVELPHRDQKLKNRYCNTTSKVKNNSRQRTLDDVMKKTAY